MLNPFLVIGLGGSGGKTLQTLQDNLLRQLRQTGWRKDSLPTAWQLLQIDVPPVQGEVSGDLPPEMSGDSYVGLVTPGTFYSVVDRALSDRLAGNELAREAMAGWRPNPNAVTVPIERGAGQYRAIGRFLTVYHMERVKRAIDNAMTRMNSLSAEAELKEIADMLGQQTETEIGNPTAVVVSSIAGGTGAGMFMDVCDVLRGTGKTWAGESMAMLFTPDVFDELPPQSRAGVRPNALASLAEILAGFWDQDGFGEDEAALLGLVGVNPRSSDNRVGPRFPILMGRSNGAVTFERQNDVYRSAGRALSSWVLSDQIQGEMSNYMTGNWAQSAQVPDRVPFKDQGQENPFQSLGFARVSLGRDRFLQYASERLARASVERLLEGHLEGKAFDDHRSDAVLLQEKVERAYPDFLAASGLDISPETAVREILDLQGFVSIRDRMRVDLLRRVFAQGETELVGHDIQDRGAREVENRRANFDGEFKRHYSARLREWAMAAQTGFVTFLLEQSAIHGVPATSAMAGRLSAHLRSVGQGLVASANEQSRAAAHTSYDMVLDETLPGDSTEAQQILDGITRKESTRNLAAALQDLSALLDELRSDVVDEAVDSLNNALAELKTQQGQAGSWPSFRESAVPQRLRPTPNERVLLSPEQFGEQLDEQLVRQFQAPDRVTARNAGIMSVVAYPKDSRAKEVQDLIAGGGRWVPGVSAARPSSDAQPRKLAIRIDFRPRTLLHQSEGFVDTPNTVLGRYVREDIADYLSQAVPAEERTKRLAAFEREFAEAMRASKPMVAVNPNAVLRIHERDVAETQVFSGIPFPQGSEAYDVARGVLTSAGLDEGTRAKAFRDVKTQHIDVFSMLASPMEPAAFDSLAKPIREQWEKASAAGPDALAEFWRFRRTRPLPQAIPMAPHVRQAMVRGWFTARVLGQIKDTLDASGVGDLAVFAPSSGAMAGTWKEFPLPLLLPQGAGREDRLAGVLKSSVISILEANNGDMESTEAYKRLRDLGASSNGMLSAYHGANPELEEWIIRGATKPGAPDPNPEWAGSQSASMDVRKERIISRLELWLTNYEERVFAPVAQLPDLGMAPRSWELRKDYLAALAALIGAVRNVGAFVEGDLG